METNNLNIRYFVDDPEASEQEMLLKLFHFEGNESNTLNIEQVPALMKSGCIALCRRGSFRLKLDGRDIPVKADDLCIVFPGMLVQTFDRSADMDCLVLAGDIGAQSARQIHVGTIPPDPRDALRADPSARA